MALCVIALDDTECDTDEDNANFYEKQRKRMKRHQKKCQRAVAHRAIELEQLKRRNAVMETLCGFGGYSQSVVDSAVSIQAAVRGWMLRCDKRVFDRCVSIFLSRCRMVLQRRRFERARESALTIQSIFRAVTDRKGPTGKAIRAVIKYKKDIALLETLTLKLASLLCTDERVETMHVRVD